MVRTILGVVAGFFAWMIVWFGFELALSAVWPEFGAHQAAFQEAIEHDGPFTPDGLILMVHVVLASIISAVAGLVAALVAGGNKRAPFIAGILLLAVGLLKALMSWSYVPVWYHVLFTAVLLPMTILGGRLRTSN
jgi:hypothetical protein